MSQQKRPPGENVAGWTDHVLIRAGGRFVTWSIRAEGRFVNGVRRTVYL